MVGVVLLADLPVAARVDRGRGQPTLVDMKVVYDETPEEMVKGVVPLLETGANIVGGCLIFALLSWLNRQMAGPEE